MNDRALLVELVRQAVRLELQPLLAQLQAPVDALTPDDRRIVDLLGAIYGAGALTTRQIAGDLRTPIGDRPALRSLLGNDNQKIGQRLRRIADRGGRGDEWCLRRADARDRGGRMFVLERLCKG